MVKIRGVIGNRSVVGLGLSEAEIARIRAGVPMVILGEEIGVRGVNICIWLAPNGIDLLHNIGAGADMKKH